jgi:SpoVK/Ycf46/Vps4 family AAA+-type ATPase
MTDFPLGKGLHPVYHHFEGIVTVLSLTLKAGGKKVLGFRENLENLLKARFPLIYIESYEEQRVLAEITAVVSDKDRLRTPRRLMVWSATEGLTVPGGQGPANSKAPADALAMAQATTEPTVFVFKDLHTAFGDNGKPADQMVIRRLRDIAYSFKNGTSLLTLIIVSPVLKLPTDLDKEITILDFPLPTESEILKILENMMETNKADGRIIFEVTESGKEKLAKSALGLTLNEAENAFARAMVEDGKLSDSDVDTVLDEKRQTIKKSGILEFINVDVALEDVGGLQNLKRWLLKRNESWLDEAKSYGLPAPKGILITGVPGCGKSLTAKAIGAAWQLPLLRLDIGKIFAGLVGSSEQNMRTAIKTAEAIAPCILWIDEIEKGFAGSSGSGDSGTSARVFGSFLTWMQEKKESVFVIATANNIDKLPPEFLRKGRFDEIFFVDLPTLSERKLIWDLHLNKRLKSKEVLGDTKLDEKLYISLAEQTEGYSGAEIEQAVVAGLFDAFSEKRSITPDDLSKSVLNMVPLSITQAEAIEIIREWANVRAVAATAAEDMAEIKTIEKSYTSKAPAPVAPTRGGRTVDF